MGFKTTQDAMEFHREFDGSFVEDNQLMIELAPYPKLPRAQRLKQDTKQSTIEQGSKAKRSTEIHPSHCKPYLNFL